jgi:hypothetical protein
VDLKGWVVNTCNTARFRGRLPTAYEYDGGNDDDVGGDDDDDSSFGAVWFRRSMPAFQRKNAPSSALTTRPHKPKQHEQRSTRHSFESSVTQSLHESVFSYTSSVWSLIVSHSVIIEVLTASSVKII